MRQSTPPKDRGQSGRFNAGAKEAVKDMALGKSAIECGPPPSAWTVSGLDWVAYINSLDDQNFKV